MKITQDHVGKKVQDLFSGNRNSDVEVLWVSDTHVLVKRGVGHPFLCMNDEEDFAEIVTPPPKKYRPFTWEERDQLRGKWVRHIATGEYGGCIEFQICDFMKFDNGFSVGPTLTETYLCEKCVFVDTGLPVGVEV